MARMKSSLSSSTVVFGILVFSNFCVCMAADFAVHGTFKMVIPQGVVARSNECVGYFSATIQENKWSIRTKRTDEDDDYFEDVCDGTNVYSVSSMESWVRKRQEKGLKVGVNTGEGIITPGAFPHNSPEQNKILWLAFASSKYLAKSNTGQVPPIATHSSRRAYLYGFTQLAFWELNKMSPNLPAYVLIFDDGRVRRWKDEDSGFLISPPQESSWRGPYVAGFTNGILSVKGYKTYGQLFLPQTIEFNVFVPAREGATTNDLTAIRTYFFETTNAISPVSILGVGPSVLGPIQTTDERFQLDKTPIFQVSYLCTNKWLSEAEVRRLPEFAKARPYEAKRIATAKNVAATADLSVAMNKNKAPKRYIALGFLVLVSVCALLGAILSATKTKNQCKK